MRVSIILEVAFPVKLNPATTFLQGLQDNLCAKMKSLSANCYTILNHREPNPGVPPKSLFPNSRKIEARCLNFIIAHVVVWEFGFSSETHEMLLAT